MKISFIRKLNSFAAISLIISLFMTPSFLSFARDGDISAVIGSITDYNLKSNSAASVQQWIDGSLTDGAGVSSEWYIIALSQSGVTYDFTAYADALDAYLAANTVRSATERQRFALALAAAGRRDDSYITSTLGDSIGELGIMSYIWGLQLLNNGFQSEKFTAGEVITELLSRRLNDGGWAIRGEISDVDVTAMALSALAPYYRTDIVAAQTISDETRNEAVSAVDGALALLSSRQLGSGGFASYGAENAESSAQVITALSALGIDVLSDARFIKDSSSPIDGMLDFQLSDGSFCHISGGESNHTATVQCYYALIALKRAGKGDGPLFILDSNTDTAPKTSETAVHNAMDAQTSPASETAPDRASDGISYKIIAYIAIAAAAMLSCVILFAVKKRGFKNYIFVIVIAGAAACFIALTDFESAEHYYSKTGEKDNIIGSVSLTIRCDRAVGVCDSEYIPESGEILPVTEFALSEGETVYDILVEAAKTYAIQLESSGAVSGSAKLAYISGINYLYEFDGGDLSGWIYRVNGEIPSFGCGDYTLSDGDAVEWLYTLELGEDLD
ncbi:MAG: DUF4430 domain-containing protein [Eubacteriales bacterium]